MDEELEELSKNFLALSLQQLKILSPKLFV